MFLQNKDLKEKRMNKHYFYRLILLGAFSSAVLTSFAGCQSSQKQKTSGEKTTTSVVDSMEIAPAFPSPKIPMTIQNVDDRAIYFVDHFWDECNFDDPNLLKRTASLEQSVANFLGIACRLPVDQVKAAFIRPLEASQGELFAFFIDTYEKYLFEPNSPFFNEEYYFPIVEWIAHSPKASLAQMERAKYRLQIMGRNRVGHPAEQFTFTQPSGEVGRLSDMRGKKTMLFFYTPGCHNCAQVLAELQEDSFFQSLIEAKQINVLFVDAETDVDEWMRTIEELPPFGVKGFNSDGRVVNVPLYDLKASPTIYLLDAKGVVLLKDANLDQIRKSLALSE